jgi:hypothetical protein
MTQATTYSVPLVGPASPTVMAQRIDDNFDAIISGHSGSARPAYAVAGMIWEDTSVANETRLYFYDGTQDILVAVVDTANDRVELAPQPLVDVASAGTTDIGAVKTRNIRVTATVAITSFGTIRAGTTRTVYFAAALTMTYNATSLITPTGASLVVAAGDSIDLVSLGGGNWRVLRHSAVSGVITPWVAYTPTFTGWGTPTNVSIRSRRVGSNLEIQGTFSSGTPTGVAAQVSLGFNGANGGLAVASSVNSLSVAGLGLTTAPGAYGLFALMLGGDAAMKFGTQQASLGGLTAAIGTDISALNRSWAIQASIPIQGW